MEPKIKLCVFVCILIGIGIVFGIAGSWIFLSLSNAQMQEASGISVQLEIQSIGPNQIFGNLSLENTSLNHEEELFYYLSLRTKEIFETKGREIPLLTEGMLISFFESESFELKAGEKKTIPVSLSYSPHIPLGRYKLQAFVMRKLGRTLGADIEEVSLTGKATFIDVDLGSCKVLVGNKEFVPNIGPNVNVGEPVKAQCAFTNASGEPKKAFPSIDYAVRHVVGYPLSKKLHLSFQDAIFFKARETKMISVDIPYDDIPQVYEALISLTDEQGQRISAFIPFRWIIRGPSAYIGDIVLDRDFYLAGEEANIKVAIGPSMDLFWRSRNAPQEGTDLINAKALVALFSGEGEQCGKKEIRIPSTQKGAWKAQNILLKLEQDCLNPRVEVQVFENELLLAEASLKTLTSDASLQEIKNIFQKRILTYILLVIVGGLGIGALLVFVMKRRMRLWTGVLFVLAVSALIGTFISIQKREAWALQVLSPTGPLVYIWGGLEEDGFPELNWSNPMYGDFWLQGSNVRQVSQDSFQVTFVGNVYGLLDCENINMGFKIFTYIDGSAEGIHINGALGSIAHVQKGTGQNGPIALTFTLSRPGGFAAGPHTLRIDFDFWIHHTIPGGEWKDSYSSSTGFNPNQAGGSCSGGCIGRVEIPFTVVVPDLIARSLNVDGTLLAGNTLNLSGVIYNQGTGAAGDSTTQFKIDGREIGTQLTGSLAVGGGESESLNWVATVGNHSFQLCADKTGQISELDENNNCSTLNFSVASNSPPRAEILCGSTSFGDGQCREFGGIPFTGKNRSSDPESNIAGSSWSLADSSGNTIGSQTCPPGDILCNFTPQELSPGPYTFYLTVRDTYGLSGSTSRLFQILRDASAGFMCSRNNTAFVACETLKLSRGERLYFKDDPLLQEHSTPSDGASITNRTWKWEGTTFESNNNANPSLVLPRSGTISITLEIRDSNARSASKSHTLNIRLGLPQFFEFPSF